MPRLTVCLLGGFCLRHGDLNLPSLESRKAQELFAYLVLRRRHLHSRDALTGLLWAECPAQQGRKHLRQALWHLQGALNSRVDPGRDSVLRIETDWVQVNPQADLWLDVTAFERAYGLVREIPPFGLDSQRVNALDQAVNLYQGDLLEGYYFDWCLAERARLQQIYLTMLHQMMAYCEAHHQYEVGMVYATRSLACEPACERTHRHLMRLYYLAGDRTAALRQYQRCCAALDAELGARPSRSTQALYEGIASDQIAELFPDAGIATAQPDSLLGALRDLLSRLDRFLVLLSGIRHQVQEQVDAAQVTLRQRAAPAARGEIEPASSGGDGRPPSTRSSSKAG